MEDDGTVTGARPRHEAGHTDPLRMQALIANNTQPPLSTTVVATQMSGDEILVVLVPDSPRVVGTAKGAAERFDLADLAAPFTADQWSAASLCAGWQVRDVIAHVVVTAELRAARHVALAIWNGMNLDRMIDRVARRAGRAAPVELVRRGGARRPWSRRSPGCSPRAEHLHGV